MYTDTLQSSRLRLLRTALCVAGLAALSMAATAADPSSTHKRCEPITKACNNPLIVPRQAATEDTTQVKAAAHASTRNRCEPITKVCIYKSQKTSESPTPAAQEKEGAAATSKRHRCEPPTKVCIYR